MAVISSTAIDNKDTHRAPVRSATGQAPALAATGMVIFSLLASGCQLNPAPLDPTKFDELSAELVQLTTLVNTTREDLISLNGAQSEQIDSVRNRLHSIDNGVQQLPTAVQTACATHLTLPTTCDDIAVQTVLIGDDKMLVGEVENLWITPPEIRLSARMDTGTSANSIHATDISLFERDSDDWVRFTLTTKAGDDSETNSVAVERRIVRLLRSSKRPVVKLRVQLGNVVDSFDFILTDRTNHDHPVVLGRTFLQDIALVDVGKQFVQPRLQKSQQQDKERAGRQ